MRPAALLLSGLTLLSAATARIEGFAAPSQVGVDSDVKIIIYTANYIQSIQDVTFSFGISSVPYPGSLGTLLSSKELGPDFSNTLDNITHFVHIPATFQKGPATITGALFSLLGAVLSPDIDGFQLNVTVGDSTNSDYIRSERISINGS